MNESPTICSVDDLESGELRPFKPQPFRERSVVSALFHKPRPEDAHAALESMLAQQGTEKISADQANRVLKQFGLSGPAGRSVLLDVWTKAFYTFFGGQQTIDAARASYLDALKSALGLTDQQVEAEKTAIVGPIFRSARERTACPRRCTYDRRRETATARKSEATTSRRSAKGASEPVK